jgi:ribosomal protein S7
VKFSGSKKSLIKGIADELIKSSEGTSESVKKTNNLHKLARQNKLFTHYRWF